MKNIYYFLFLLMFFSCKKTLEPVEPQLVAGFEIQHINNSVFILNKTQNAVKYDLDYGDGTKVIDQTELKEERLGYLHSYQKDGVYTITLTVYSANGLKEQTSNQIGIDFFAKNPAPVAAITFDKIANGTFRINDVSKNVGRSQFYLSTSKSFSYPSSSIKNPIFEFDINGTYQVTLNVDGITWGSDEKQFTIEVNDAPQRELGYFKGIWYGDSTNHTETFEEGPVTSYTDGREGVLKLSNTYFVKNQRLTIINNEIDLASSPLLADSVGRQQTRENFYRQIQDKFKVGLQDTTSWIVGFPKYSMYSELQYEDAKNKSIEILEIREVSQRKIVPEMMDKAFWITFKIKADFGEKGKIDGILKTRYLIY